MKHLYKKFLCVLLFIAITFTLTSLSYTQPAPRPMVAPRPAAMQPALVRPAPASPAAMAPTAPRPAPMARPAARLAPAPMATAPAPAVATEAPAEAPKPATKKEGKKDSWWKVLLGGLSEVALTFLLFILLGLGGIGVRWAAKKLKITNAAQITQMESVYGTLITMGVNYASQMAHKLRNNPDSKGKKMDWAVEFVQKLIKDWKLPEKTADWIKKRVEAKLGETERKPAENKPT